MKTKNKTLRVTGQLVVVFGIATLLIVVSVLTETLAEKLIHREPQGEVLATSTEKQLTHQQEIWMAMLEWCESRGKPTAINPKDSDGQPSYGAFQFRQATLDYYAERYGIATTTIMDYDVQKKVIRAMILDQEHINWRQQFPLCVKKNGPPPA